MSFISKIFSWHKIPEEKPPTFFEKNGSTIFKAAFLGSTILIGAFGVYHFDLISKFYPSNWKDNPPKPDIGNQNTGMTLEKVNESVEILKETTQAAKNDLVIHEENKPTNGNINSSDTEEISLFEESLPVAEEIALKQNFAKAPFKCSKFGESLPVAEGIYSRYSSNELIDHAKSIVEKFNINNFNFSFKNLSEIKKLIDPKHVSDFDLNLAPFIYKILKSKAYHDKPNLMNEQISKIKSLMDNKEMILEIIYSYFRVMRDNGVLLKDYVAEAINISKLKELLERPPLYKDFIKILADRTMGGHDQISLNMILSYNSDLAAAINERFRL
jgi:hypothetical protein